MLKIKILMKNLYRRDFLKISGLCGLVLGGCSSISFENQLVKKERTNFVSPIDFNLENLTEANKLLVNFPDKIPRAESINKYLTPGAKYCMAHIRQTHLIENASKKDLKEIKKVQDNIYEIISYLVENYRISKVYCEGLTYSDAIIKNTCAKLSFNNSQVYLFFKDRIEYDAVYRFASKTDKLEIAGAETSKRLTESKYMRDRLKGFGFFKWFTERKKILDSIFEKREDVFLDIASKQENPMVIIIYGARHDWGGEISCGKNYKKKGPSICDNIAKWNSNNPNKKFSLIEVAPFGL